MTEHDEPTHPASAGPSDMLRMLASRRIPGGCDDCHAEQVAAELAPNVFGLRVEHDDSCPWLAKHVENRATR